MTRLRAPATLTTGRANGDPGCHSAGPGVAELPGRQERPMYPTNPMSHTGAAGSGMAPPAHPEA
jgi:hypothetical protein